jgi:hypothetical protein
MSDYSHVRSILQKFQDGYTSRNVAKLDEFMQLFVQSEAIEMMGIGATQRHASEWYEGISRIREFIGDDWKYWGDVSLDVEGAKISIQGDVAWLSTAGKVTRTRDFDPDIEYHLNDMKAFLDREDLSADEKLMEVTYYGMRRWRERTQGIGHSRKLVFTAVLVRVEGEWRFHSQHWAMPVN